MEKITVDKFIDYVLVQGKKSENFINRNYVPISEKEDSIDDIITPLFYEHDEELDTYIEDFRPNNSLVNDVLVKTEIIKLYTNIEVEDVKDVYDKLCKENLLTQLIAEIGNDAKVFEKLFYDRLRDFRKFKEMEYTSRNITVTSEFDEIIPSILDLLKTINKKCDELDVIALNDKVQKLDLGNLVKSYLGMNSTFKNGKE